MAAREKIIRIDETTEMLFKDEASKKYWDEMVEINSHDRYGKGIVDYARRWAKYMQTLIAKGMTVSEIAEKTSYDADIDGVTGFMYGCAVQALSQSWKYGEELRKWNNKKYGYEGDGSVNPAILNFSIG